jgi:hypothetical protein
MRRLDRGMATIRHKPGHIAASDLSRTSYSPAFLRWRGCRGEVWTAVHSLQVIENERRIEMRVEHVYRQSFQMAHFVANRCHIPCGISFGGAREWPLRFTFPMYRLGSKCAIAPRSLTNEEHDPYLRPDLFPHPRRHSHDSRRSDGDQPPTPGRLDVFSGCCVHYVCGLRALNLHPIREAE